MQMRDRQGNKPTHLMERAAVDAAIASAYDPIIVRNALTRPEGYSPYCMRCDGFHRMESVGLLRWRHHCGAEHDEAEARAALERVQAGAA